jgi:hypothetical protein
METNRMRKAIAILLAVMFVLTVTVAAVSAASPSNSKLTIHVHATSSALNAGILNHVTTPYTTIAAKGLYDTSQGIIMASESKKVVTSGKTA